MPGKKMRSVKRPATYESLRDKGMSKESAARIANKGATKKGREQMAKKAAKTRKKSK